LPGLDGLGVLDRLRQTGRETPFILMTAYHTDDLVAKAMERGATAVLEKPVNLDRLRRQCRRALGD
jgi:DNA-binding NtrC family response regulator